MLWRAINILFLLSRPCDLSLPCSCLAHVGLEMGTGICQLPGRHRDPTENESSTEALQHFAHIWWCRRVFYSFPAFKKCLKSSFVFKLSRHFKLAKPLVSVNACASCPALPSNGLAISFNCHTFATGRWSICSIHQIFA